MKLTPLVFAVTHTGEIAHKSSLWFIELLKDSMKFYNPIILLLSGITFFIPSKNSRVKILKTITLAGIVVQTLLVLPFGAVPYYYMFFSLSY